MSPKSRTACLICEVRGPGLIVQVGLCRDHLALLQGRPPLEAHHPVGRANGSETVDLPVSVHSVLSSKQARWPATLRNPSGDPIIQVARRERALRDFLAWFLSASERDSDWLLALALNRQDAVGLEWWTVNPVAPLYPAGGEG